MNQQHDVDVNLIDDKKCTPLHFAVLQCEVKNVELLIKLGANVNC
jgi:ankyrin repeat protein